MFFEVEYRDSRGINIGGRHNRVGKVANIKYRKNIALLSYKKRFYDINKKCVNCNKLRCILLFL